MRFSRVLSSLVAIALLAVSGCGQSTRTLSQPNLRAGGLRSARDVAPLQLITQPDDGSAAIVSAIDGATRSVWLELYLLTDPAVIDALCRAAERGLDVKVLLEQDPANGGSANQEAANALQARGVKFAWTSPSFVYTHAKTMLVDGSAAYVLTYNLSRAATEANREFGLVDRSPSDVSELKRIFTADWSRTPYQPLDPDLVVSPDNARMRILGLMDSARQQLLVGVEVLSDPEVLALLAAKRKAGVDVRVIVGGVKKVPANLGPGRTLVDGGIPVRSLAKPYWHAKLVIADGRDAYVGSINLTSNSLDANRELGLLIHDGAAIASLSRVWEGDWGIGEPIDPSVPAPVPSEGL